MTHKTVHFEAEYFKNI